MNVYLDLVGEYEEDREVYIFRVRLLLLTEEVAEHDEAFVRWEVAASFVLGITEDATLAWTQLRTYVLFHNNIKGVTIYILIYITI